tara:strand:+ start:629 stop:895 length:267 start_codon:yes stop_codon:yes gene_type:complete
MFRALWSEERRARGDPTGVMGTSWGVKSARHQSDAQVAAKSPCRLAKGVPILVGAPPVRRAARRSRGTFGAFRASMLAGLFVSCSNLL